MLLLKTFILACAVVLAVATNGPRAIAKESLTLPTSFRASGSTKIDGLLQKRQQTCEFGPGSPVCSATTCCRPGEKCCQDDGCCLSTEQCVGTTITTGCCPQDDIVCSDELSCCRSGTTCCGNGCCPAGSICQLDECHVDSSTSSSSTSAGSSQTALTFLGVACAMILYILN